jgi:hypothetical protein
MALEVDADKLDKDGDEFNNIASIAYSIYGFLAKGASMIRFPEDDDISRMFAEQWNNLVDGTKTLLQGFRGGMLDVATNVHTTADLYKASNIVNTESITPPPTIHR